MIQSLKDLEEKIINKKAKIAIIGLGYVGLPVACMFAKAGFHVIGIDLKKERVNQINAGVCPIEGFEPNLPELLTEVVGQKSLITSTDYSHLADADIVLIDVETPTDHDNMPQYVALRSACTSLGKVMKDNVLIIIESTIAPGTVKQVVRPLLESEKQQRGLGNYHLGVCPERVMPGKLLVNLESMSRVCGGETEEVSKAMILLYRNIVSADLDSADIITAEITKTAENTYRDVNIAFANELALICQSIGADFLKVRELVNKSPGRNVLMAGAGVGGHCIPKDPWLLAYGAKGRVDLNLIPTARLVNDSMPLHIAKMTEKALADLKVPLSQAKIAILGYAYLEESDDTRNSPSETLIRYLQSKCAELVVHDPYVPIYQDDLSIVINGCDAIIIMVGHRVYADLNLAQIYELLRTPILIDGRRVINPEKAKNANFWYYGIGFGKNL